ncbi:hypothetical protein IUY40_09380 [Flavobacterium sp. ALJ2]|uniref:hypothetical protein n=1 Tax=Flavobacterium sp. ALJ2 TaxID=2786960 RepID=UPI00189D50A7|nr:hypothetical protein [Flavobacterium sp. ALJ2]MBF7091753.1 hypothetical protein [Flavobacterium sp. ALJ2]
MKYAQDFIQSYWAIENQFESTYVSQSILDKLLKGKIKTLTELRKSNSENYAENKFYTVIHYKVKEETSEKTFDISEKTFDIIDSIFINEQ